MCLRAVIKPEVGAVCPICSSKVERILEIADGGRPHLGKKRGLHNITVKDRCCTPFAKHGRLNNEALEKTWLVLGMGSNISSFLLG
jgi:hypothetical protein